MKVNRAALNHVAELLDQRATCIAIGHDDGAILLGAVREVTSFALLRDVEPDAAAGDLEHAVA